VRVGIVTSSYPRFDGDFAGHFVHRSALRLIERGHEVRVIAPRPEQPGSLTTPPGLELCLAPTPQGVFYGAGAPENLRRLGWRAPDLALRSGLALARHAERHLQDAEVLIGHWVLPGGLIAAWLAGTRPFMVVAHSSGARMALRAPAPMRSMIGFALSRAAVVSATDPELAGALAALRGGAVHWLGPDCGAPKAGPVGALRPVRPARPLTLGFLGRRAPIKGLDLLVEAVKGLVERENLALRLVVGGPLEVGALPLRAAWLDDRGLIHGDQAKREFFADVDVLVVPSRRMGARQEGLPCVLLEAWSAGVPVLMSDTGAGRWIVPSAWRFGSLNELSARLRALALGGVPDDGGLSRVARLTAIWTQTEAHCYEKLGL